MGATEGLQPMPVLLAFATVLVLVSGAVTAFDGYDGLPRPAGMDDTPTSTYGPNPKVKYENKVTSCIWYGWENVNYEPAVTKNCSKLLWASLSQNANPAQLSAYTYFAPLEPEFYDAEFGEYLCAIGCFDLASSNSPPGVASPPGSPPPATESPPASLPPVVAPGSSQTPPLSPMTPPPPATLFKPPPPPAAKPPSSVTPGGAPPPTTSLTPAASAPGPAPQTGAGIILRLWSSASTALICIGTFLSIGLHLLSAF